MRVVWKKYTFVFWMSFCPKAPSIWVVGISPSINRSLYVISDLITTKSGEFSLSLSLTVTVQIRRQAETFLPKFLRSPAVEDQESDQELQEIRRPGDQTAGQPV